MDVVKIISRFARIAEQLSRLLPRCLLLTFVCTYHGTALGEKFLPDDPIWRDADDCNTPTPVKVTVADYYDFLENTFSSPGDQKKIRALNINSLGEVPGSNWFTNRHGLRSMSIDELVRGPDKGGPLQDGKWQVIQNKLGGISPGFRIMDSTGTIYQLKFDPLTNPEMATSAEVICTKFFYAIGYFVAEDYIVRFSREQLTISPKAKFIDMVGKTRPMKPADIDEILTRAATDSDGTYRAVASKFIPGKPVGEYLYYGTRADDPNDIFPHEHRRELRALRVFCAWLNHDDSRSVNTFNTLITEGGRQFIRHYLFDFGSTLGSGSTVPQKARASNEYLWEPAPTFKSIFSLGLWVRPWLKIKYPNYPSLGNFEADFFRPEKWKPEYPNPAFRNMTNEDAFWAARIVMSFTDEQIKAIVRTGQLSDSKAEEYLVTCLIKRRDKVGQYWLNQVNPLDNFEIQGEELVFDNAAIRHHVAQPGPTNYEAEWSSFDNRTGVHISVDLKQKTDQLHIPVPAAAFTSPVSRGVHYGLVEIKSNHGAHPSWGKPVLVYLRKTGNTISVIGVDRE